MVLHTLIKMLLNKLRLQETTKPVIIEVANARQARFMSATVEHHSHTIDVLLGSNYYHLILPMKGVPGKENEPSAR